MKRLARTNDSISRAAHREGSQSELKTQALKSHDLAPNRGSSARKSHVKKPVVDSPSGIYHEKASNARGKYLKANCIDCNATSESANCVVVKKDSITAC